MMLHFPLQITEQHTDDANNQTKETTTIKNMQNTPKQNKQTEKKATIAQITNYPLQR